MLPAYHSWQLVVLKKNIKHFAAGDVVAFRSEKLDAILVKRIVAMPGDTVRVFDGILYVNDIAYAEIVYAGTVEYPVELNNNEYFVLGDNYEESIDSRYLEVGCVNSATIIGKII